MGDKTGIEWTDATWNPVTGCDKVSPGCDHCYAETFAERWRGTEGHYFANGFDVQLRPDKLDLPLRWTKPRKVFVNSMSDLFHDSVPDAYIGSVFDVMARAEQHTFQILTKRHGRMRALLRKWEQEGAESVERGELHPKYGAAAWRRRDGLWCTPRVWPLPNVWLGVSAEDQKRADLRIPALLDTRPRCGGSAPSRYLDRSTFTPIRSRPVRHSGVASSTGWLSAASPGRVQGRCIPIGRARCAISASGPGCRSCSNSGAIGCRNAWGFTGATRLRRSCQPAVRCDCWLTASPRTHRLRRPVT